MDDSSKAQIFSTIVNGFFADFSDEYSKMTSSVVDASLNVYNRIAAELLPTPARSHYTFNLRDLAKVFQGLLMITPKKLESKEQLVRLWIHECRRVYEDRLINYDDQDWFEQLLKKQVGETLKMPYTEIMPKGTNRIFFGDYIIPGADPKLYEEIVDHPKMIQTIEDYLNDYNTISKSPMHLVLFLDAVEHVSRITRVLRQPSGNVLALGVGGSGRQSLTRLATSISEYDLVQPEIAKGYGVFEWREDLKKCLLHAGLKNKPITFLFSDVQIVWEEMLEDINNILNSADLPNLYAAEEMDMIMSTCRIECTKRKLQPTPINIFSQYIARVRNNIHLVICMSPMGEKYRNRLRMFPSLVNCATIDWFMP
jgi:dynein heavy chain